MVTDVVNPSPTPARRDHATSGGSASNSETFLFLCMSEVHREHYDDSVYFVSTATLRASIDSVLEGFAFVNKKRLLTDALLYGLSLMARYPLNPLLEDETARTVLEIMLQGIVQVLVNLDVLLDLQQYLNATRACRVCDLIRWCQATNRPQLLDVAAALSLSLAHYAFPRLPSDISESVSLLKHGVDVIRRAYCGYDDCEEVCCDAGRLKSPENFYALKDVMFLLDSVRRWFKKEIQEASQHDAATTPLLPKDCGAASGRSVNLERYKQHPWMIGGAAKELHFVCTVPLRMLESWCGMSCDVDLRLMQTAGKARKEIEKSEMESREALRTACAAASSSILQREIWQRIEFRIHAEELDARREIEVSYDSSCENIALDLRRLLWHFQQYLRQLSATLAQRNEAGGDEGSQSMALKPFVPPRLYFLELVELHSIPQIELTYRDEVARQERYAFHALREAWNLDFQFLQEIMADEIKERALRALHMQQLSLRTAEEAAARKGFAVSRATSASLATWPYGGGDGTRLHGGPSPSSLLAPKLVSDLVFRSPTIRSRDDVDDEAASAVAAPHGWNTPGLIPSWAGSRAPTTALASAVPWSSTAGRFPAENYDSQQPPHPLAWDRFAPAALLHHRYVSPHTTTPSSLGFVPRIPRGVVMPLSGVTSPMLVATGDECHANLAAATAHGGSATPSSGALGREHEPGSSIATYKRSDVIHVGVRVVSPDAGDTQRAAARGGRAMFQLHMQDLLDDEDIERALVEDEERTASDRLRQSSDYRRVVALDWSMNGYLRATSRAAAAANSRTGWLPSVPLHSSAATPGNDSRVGRISREDAQRHLPVHMRSVPLSRSGRSTSTSGQAAFGPQPPSTPPQLYLVRQQQFVREAQRADGGFGDAPLLTTEWENDSTAGVTSRPVSRLLVDILVKGASPIGPKYGPGVGSAAPVSEFMPAVYRRRH